MFHTIKLKENFAKILTNIATIFTKNLSSTFSLFLTFLMLLFARIV